MRSPARREASYCFGVSLFDGTLGAALLAGALGAALLEGALDEELFGVTFEATCFL